MSSDNSRGIGNGKRALRVRGDSNDKSVERNHTQVDADEIRGSIAGSFSTIGNFSSLDKELRLEMIIRSKDTTTCSYGSASSACRILVFVLQPLTAYQFYQNAPPEFKLDAYPVSIKRRELTGCLATIG